MSILAQQQPRKSQKKVGFDLNAQNNASKELEADDQAQPVASLKQRNLMLGSTRDIYVAKAREFESFKNIPRFSHKLGAVIHPSPSKLKREQTHKPPKTLNFDGVPVALAKRPEKPQLPEELVRPPIDEEKLFKLREQDKLRKSQ